VYGYDLETKAQSSQWKHSSSSRPKEAQLVQSKVKVLLTVFFDYCGIMHHSYAPEGQTINNAIGNCIMTMPQLTHHA
jgi:hypothetical protein